MRKRIIGILIFFIIFYALTFGECQDATTEESVEVSQEVVADVLQPSILDQASDWWATLGKSEEEKAQILEERRLKRLEQGSKSTIEGMKIQAQEKISTVKEEAKNKAVIMKEEAKIKATVLKEEVGKKVTVAKERASHKITESKERVRQKVEETKVGISSQVDTQKQKIKQESEKTFNGFIRELFK